MASGLSSPPIGEGATRMYDLEQAQLLANEPSTAPSQQEDGARAWWRHMNVTLQVVLLILVLALFARTHQLQSELSMILQHKSLEPQPQPQPLPPQQECLSQIKELQQQLNENTLTTIHSCPTPVAAAKKTQTDQMVHSSPSQCLLPAPLPLAEPIVPLARPPPISWPITVACIHDCAWYESFVRELLDFYFTDWRMVHDFVPNRDALVITGMGGVANLPPNSKVKRWMIGTEPLSTEAWADYDLVFNCVTDPILRPFRARGTQLYLPFYVTNFYERKKNRWIDLLKPKVQTQPRRPRFCAFIQRNCGVEFRNKFFLLLNATKFVEATGPCMHNYDLPTLGSRSDHSEGHHWVDTAVDALREYRFVIAFENSALAGYMTEKIINPMLAGAIPIYFGAIDVAQHFNPRSFIDARAFPDFAAVVNEVMRLDQDHEAYEEMRRQPFLHHNQLNQFFPDPVLRPDNLFLPAVRALYDKIDP